MEHRWYGEELYQLTSNVRVASYIHRTSVAGRRSIMNIMALGPTLWRVEARLGWCGCGVLEPARLRKVRTCVSNDIYHPGACILQVWLLPGTVKSSQQLLSYVCSKKYCSTLVGSASEAILSFAINSWNRPLEGSHNQRKNLFCNCNLNAKGCNLSIRPIHTCLHTCHFRISSERFDGLRQL